MAGTTDRPYRELVARFGAGAFHGRERGVRVARKHLGWYLDGRPGARGLCDRVLRMTDPAEVLRAIRRGLTWPAGLAA